MPNNVETTTVDRIINQGKEEIVKPGMNYCNVKLNNGFFPTKRAESKSEFNFVSCGPKRFCQPLDREGEGLSEIGYSFYFLVFVFTCTANFSPIKCVTKPHVAPDTL